MTVICELEDLRRLYRRRVPRMFQGYCESGSWHQQTLALNQNDFKKILFRQRVARDLEPRSLKTTLVGQQVAMPLALAPVGMLGLQHADGEILAAQAAEEFGIPFTLSTMSICSIEAVAAHTRKPFWFQLYAQKDRKFTRQLIERAKTAGCSALMVTLDLQVIGQRHADYRNGLVGGKLTLPNILDICRRPRWAWRMLQTEHRGFGNIQGHAQGVDQMNDLMQWIADSFDTRLTWEDVKQFRSWWDGPLIVKGIMEADDARQCVNLGADALVVSNHGGRQLDGAPSSISVLPEIVDAVGDKIEVWVDGGVRSGQDMIRARAQGARGVLVGRPLVYALGAEGRPGVRKMLEIFHQEAELTMAFMGHRDIARVSKGDIRLQAGPIDPEPSGTG